MAATFANLTALPAGVTTPADCVLQSLTEKESVEEYSYANSSGVTVVLVPGKLVTTECTLEVVGTPPLTLTAGAFTAGTYKQVSAKSSESNEDFEKGSVVFHKYATAS
jgi:hypothetical protein